MAPLEAELVEFDARGAVAEVLRRAGRRSLVVLLTALEPSIEHGLLPLLPALATRHHLLIASVSDPAVHAMAAGRGDLEAVLAAAANALWPNAGVSPRCSHGTVSTSWTHCPTTCRALSRTAICR